MGERHRITLAMFGGITERPAAIVTGTHRQPRCVHSAALALGMPREGLTRSGKVRSAPRRPHTYNVFIDSRNAMEIT
jgi:hypothetical protein